MTANSKFLCRVYLGSEKTQAENHRIVFSDNTPGRCLVTVKANPEPNTLVAIDLGWGSAIDRVFFGYIERVTPVENGWSSLFCRELAAILYKPLNIIMRHPTLMQLLSEVTNKTGLQFVVPEKAYSKTAIPCFYSDGNGYRVMDELGHAFGIDELFWQQQGNGQIYVGSWYDSFWAERPVNIPNQLMSNHSVNKSVSIPAIPKIRPGVMVNGIRLTGVEFEGTEVKITWM